MSDVSKTNELVSEAREAAVRSALWDIPHLLFRLADALVAATRVPVQGEPNDDRECDCEAGPGSAGCKKWCASRATAPDAATAESERRAWAIAGHLERDREAVKAERDAALAAIERVAAVHEKSLYDGGKCLECDLPWPCATLAALDGAPEPEWEYGFHFLDDDGSIYKTRGGWDTPEKAQALGDEWIVDERESHMLNDQPDIHVALIRRRKAGPWLPVEGERP